MSGPERVPPCPVDTDGRHYVPGRFIDTDGSKGQRVFACEYCDFVFMEAP